jgi:RNA polymerase sigma-70 factor (sigma-E family)
MEVALRPPRTGLREAIEQHYTPLLRLAVLLSGSVPAGEDLVQEAFVRSADRLDQLDAGRIRSYLRSAVLNLWRNHLRRLRLQRRHESAAVEGSEPVVDERLDLLRAVGSLPYRQRACIVLRFYEGLTERETAEALGCSIGTVKSSTSRGIAKLREEWI